MNISATLHSRPLYRNLLEGYLGLYRPMAAALPAENTPRQAPRVKMLERDLAALGASPAEIQRVPDSPTIASLVQASDDSAWGALYVVEGSQLGGQYLYRAVQQQLGCDQDSGAAFFFGAGDRTGSEWKQFQADLEAQVHDPERAAEGAVAMFHEFESWLTGAQRHLHLQEMPA